MTVVPQQAPEVEIVTGVIGGIIDKGGDKWQVAVQSEGSQYSRNLWTKDIDLVNQLSALIGAMMTFQCGISHWTNNQGQPVRSLWINGVGPAGHSVSAQAQPQPQTATQAVAQAMHPQQVFQGQQPQPQPQVQPQPMQPQAQQSDRMSDREKQPMIHRQTASKVAAILLGYLPAEERTLDTLLTVSERLVAYYDNGMDEVVPANEDTDGFPPGW